MMMSLYFALGILLLIAVAESISTSQPDRLRDDVDTGTRNSKRAHRISDRISCSCCHRCCIDRVVSNEAPTGLKVVSQNLLPTAPKPGEESKSAA